MSDPASERPAALPFLTAELPGCGGVLRDSPEDFDVEELPARASSGRGDFARALVRKRGISTPELQRRLAAALGLRAGDVGVAGNKDADAVARQWISVPWAKEPKLSAASIRDVEILEITRDEAPLHLGELAGNRFVIRVRGIGADATRASEAEALVRARRIASVLARRGVPAFFGAQRFGTRVEAAELGRRLLLGDAAGALDLLLGSPSPLEADPRARAFREAYERCAYHEAQALVPGRLATESRLLERLARGRSKAAVAGEIPIETRRFALTAWQSLQMNRMLVRRLAKIDVALEGDLLVEGRRSAARRCTDPLADQPAVARLELHPTVPLFGERVAIAEGEPGAMERAVLEESGITPDRLRRPAGLPLFGERREVRFAARDLAIDLLSGERTLIVRFVLPPGSFATTVLGEITKSFHPPI